MKGSLRITARIGASGDVSHVATSANSGLSAPVLACLVQRVETARFAAPCGGGATIVIPISFVPEPRGG